MSCRLCYEKHAKCVRPVEGAACERCKRKGRRCMRRLKPKYKKYKRRRVQKPAKRKRDAGESEQPSSLQKKSKPTPCALPGTDFFLSMSEPLSQLYVAPSADNSPTAPSEKKAKLSENNDADCILDTLL